MISIQTFTVNDFKENTYILYDKTRECVIIDPGCNSSNERAEIVKFVDENKLIPVKLLNTHCHIDHILGNRFVADNYNLSLEMHQADLPLLAAASQVAEYYGLDYDPSPEPGKFLTENDTIGFGHSQLEIVFVPGHAPGHIAFYCPLQKFIISGDVLFLGGIGRTDLPGADYNVLISSITEELLPLGDDIQVYPGHGRSTNTGFERLNNPFLVSP